MRTQMSEERKRRGMKNFSDGRRSETPVHRPEALQALTKTLRIFTLTDVHACTSHGLVGIY